MKKLLLFLFLSASLSGFAQKNEDSTGIKLFNRGLDFYAKGQLDSSMAIWLRFVDEKIAVGYDTYGNAFLNVPTLYWQMKNFSKAKEWYQKILASDLRDSDAGGSAIEPFTNYKHKAAIGLAGLYLLDSNHTEVLHWLSKADTVYRYWGSQESADNISKKQSYVLDWKIDAYLGLNRKEEAIRAIITELICSGTLENFFREQENRLLGLVDWTTFKARLDESLGNITVLQKDSSHWVASFTLQGLPYTIPVSSVYPDRNLPHYWRIHFVPKGLVVDKQHMTEFIRERNFYKRLKG